MPGMQRLFSMFPTGSPGIALLLLRFALAATMLNGLPEPAGPESPWVVASTWVVVIALCAGFLTPLTALLSVAIELAVWRLTGALEAIHVCAILVALALTMLGPGSYSMDARLFGRRQVIFSTSDNKGDE